jgi:hypothetical protein
VTNKPDGDQIPDEASRMAADIAWVTSPGHEEHGDLLVMLQAFGHPKGTSVGVCDPGASTCDIRKAY